MVIDFSVENFKSIKELQTLSMSAASISSKFKEIDESNIIKISDKLSLLKSKAIYGANASGKSNIIKALSAFISIISNSVKDDNCLGDNIWPFRLSTETESKPTFFQLSFIFNDVYYRYGFEANRKQIIAEWLFGTPGKKEVPFFTREGVKIKVNENQFKEGNKVIDLYGQENNDIARDNSLFLTAVKSFSSGLAKEIVDFIGGIIVVAGLTDFKMHKNAEEEIVDDVQRKRIVEFLKIADTGILNINRIEYQSPNDMGKGKVYLTTTEHRKFDASLQDVGPVSLFMITEESEGSKKMFEISPLLAKVLKGNNVLVMDEFDARFHPLLTKKILELFNSNSNKSSQLIFATHDTNLLSAKLLRRDQVCFVEKDKYGGSHFYSLVDFKGVRNDASFEKDYISGKYGAIPFLGDFSSLID